MGPCLAGGLAGVSVVGSCEQTILTALWAGLEGLERLSPQENYWQAFSFLDALDRAHAAGADLPTRDVTANRTLAAAVVTGRALHVSGPRFAAAAWVGRSQG